MARMVAKMCASVVPPAPEEHFKKEKEKTKHIENEERREQDRRKQERIRTKGERRRQRQRRKQKKAEESRKGGKVSSLVFSSLLEVSPSIGTSRRCKLKPAAESSATAAELMASASF